MLYFVVCMSKKIEQNKPFAAVQNCHYKKCRDFKCTTAAVVLVSKETGV